MTLAERIRLILQAFRIERSPTTAVVATRITPHIKTRARTRAINLYNTAIGEEDTSTAKALAGGRLTVDSQYGFIAQSTMVILPPIEADQEWRMGNLDSKTLSRITPARLLELLAELSPDVSRALFDFIRMCNPGWECNAYNIGSTDTNKTINKPAQAVIDGFLNKLDDLYGTCDVVWGRLFMAGFIRGAFLAELVLAENVRDSVDLIIPDPYTVRFQLRKDPVRGLVPMLVQWQYGELVQLDLPTIRYIPVDPFPANPYGRAMVAPAAFTAIFLLGLLHDLRRVVAQQGYPRLDIMVNIEKLAAAMPSAVESDPTAMKEWVNAITDEVSKAYADLEPDDAYIHTDIITVNRPVGTVSSDSLSAVDGLIQALERMSVRALKTTPFMMGSADGMAETQANRVWEAHLQNIKSIQHYVETLIERLLNVSLQAQGIQANVEFRFAENRASEMMRDEQTRALNIANTKAEYDSGWISQDEAAEKVVGHLPDQPEPRASSVPVNVPAPDTTTNPDPGTNKSIYTKRTNKRTIAGDSTGFFVSVNDVESIYRDRLAQIAAKAMGATLAVIRLKNDQADQKARDASLQLMKDRLNNLGKQLASNDVSMLEFTTRSWQEIIEGTAFAYRVSLDRALTEAEVSEVNGILTVQRDYFEKFIGDIVAADDFNFVANRNTLYSVAAVEAAAKGTLAKVDQEQEVEWVYGGTIKHCATCEEMAGVHTKSELLSSGILPGIGTECGPNCGCSIEEVQ